MFPSTRHTLLRQASGPGQKGAALDEVLRIYWQPCYRYLILRFRVAEELSQDLVQDFFTTLLDQDILGRYDAARGPFRPYLRACLDQFVFKHFERMGAEKRGGVASFVPLEEALVCDPTGTPEEIFQREWQREVFALAVEDLRAFAHQTGRAVRYEVFAAYDLSDEPRPSYQSLAEAHQVPVTAVTNYLAWARRELRRLVIARLDPPGGSAGDKVREIRSLLDAEPR